MRFILALIVMLTAGTAFGRVTVPRIELKAEDFAKLGRALLQALGGMFFTSGRSFLQRSNCRFRAMGLCRNTASTSVETFPL